MKYRVVIAVAVAALLWFFMFSPWTGGLVGFWLSMTFAALVLSTMVFFFSGRSFGFVFANTGADWGQHTCLQRVVFHLLLGIIIAFALWGVFWVGDKLSALMFDFARPQVDNVYAMKRGFPSWIIALLLLFVIGPAEELFWRGFVQRNLVQLFGTAKYPADVAFLATSVVYALVHIWSFNFMLVMAALVAGCVWGFIYRLRPSLLPALIVSHAVWDALVFVIIPI